MASVTQESVEALPAPCVDDENRAHADAHMASKLRATFARSRAARERALTDPTILDQARSMIERRLAADPRDVKVLLQLGDLQRKMGEIDAALATYRKLRRLQDDDLAAWRVGALTSDEPLTDAPDDLHPTPFVRVADFLDSARQDALLEAVRAGPEHFSLARVGDYDKYEYAGAVKLEIRAALVGDGPVRRQVRSWFVDELKGLLPKVFERFGVADMREFHVELDVTAHQAGDFFRPHQDDGIFGTRQVSFVYYFHREPKSFVGGELLLYDSHPAQSRCRTTAFTRLEPVRNSLVFFPSGYYHEVLPVRCDSDAFENARFTVNGWLHRASDWAAHREKRENTKGCKQQADARKPSSGSR